MLASASTVYAGTTECPESMISRERSLRGMRRNRSPLLGRGSFDTVTVFRQGWIQILCFGKIGQRENRRKAAIQQAIQKTADQGKGPLKLWTDSLTECRTRNRAEAELTKVSCEHRNNNEKRSHAGILYKRETNTKFAENHICYYHRRRK